MAVVRIRIPNEYDQVIKDYLALTGKSISEFAVESMMEIIEDSTDIETYEKSVIRDKNKATMTHKKLKRELGLWSLREFN